MGVAWTKTTIVVFGYLPFNQRSFCITTDLPKELYHLNWVPRLIFVPLEFTLPKLGVFSRLQPR